MKYEPTKCWDCANAVPSKEYGCDWSRDGKPVKGWVAKEDIVGKANSWLEPIQSYNVKSCPEYIPGFMREPQEMSDEGAKNFAIAKIRYEMERYAKGVYNYYETGIKSSDLVSAAVFLSSAEAEAYGDVAGMEIDWLVEGAKKRARRIYEQPALTNSQIRNLIKARDITIADAERLSGHGKNYLSNIINGHRKKMTDKERKEIALALELTSEELKAIRKGEWDD